MKINVAPVGVRGGLSGKHLKCWHYQNDGLKVISRWVQGVVGLMNLWPLVRLWVVLTHWGRDKMAAIFQTTFSNAFSWMKMFKFRLRFHWSLFPRVQLTIFQALVQIMAWHRPGDKPLSEPMMVSLLTHICVTRPQCVNYSLWCHRWWQGCRTGDVLFSVMIILNMLFLYVYFVSGCNKEFIYLILRWFPNWMVLIDNICSFSCLSSLIMHFKGKSSVTPMSKNRVIWNPYISPVWYIE